MSNTRASTRASTRTRTPSEINFRDADAMLQAIQVANRKPKLVCTCGMDDWLEPWCAIRDGQSVKVSNCICMSRRQTKCNQFLMSLVK